MSRLWFDICITLVLSINTAKIVLMEENITIIYK
jgi:hypothetical protein